jgi:N4-gp56 family major capsid protein
MADTVVGTGLRVQQWDSKFFTEYLTENRYFPGMGTGANAAIEIREDITKKPGDSITFALVNRLKQTAVLGSAMMEGNEEDMSTRSFRLYIDKRRNAVRIPEMEQIKSAIDLRDAARATLKDWSLKDTEAMITEAFGAISGVPFLTATAAQRNAWITANADRVQIGKLKSNYSTVFNTAMGNIDNTDDKLTPEAVSLMKRIAIEADPKIAPIRVEERGAKRWYVMYAAARPFRDLKINATIVQAQREVTLAEQNNKLFEGGDIVWDGVIVKEVPDIATVPVSTVGNAIAIAPVYLCGAQAIGVAYAKRWHSITKTFDYGDKYGVAMESIMGVRKIEFGTSPFGDTTTLKDNGVVTGWFAAVADA